MACACKKKNKSKNKVNIQNAIVALILQNGQLRIAIAENRRALKLLPFGSAAVRSASVGHSILNQQKVQLQRAFRENNIALRNLGIDTCFLTPCPKGKVCFAGFCVDPL